MVAAFTLGRLLNRFRRSGRESPEPAVPTESVESIFRVLADNRYQVANDRLGYALEELEDVYSPEEIETCLNEAVTEWSKSRPEGAGNPPRRPEMVQVLRVVIQEFQESRYRLPFANHYRELNSIERGYRSDIEGVIVRLEAEGPTDRGNRHLGEQEADNSDDLPAGPAPLDFRGKNIDDIQNMLRSAGNVVILGEPGSGKSTLLRYLAANCAASESEGALVPLLLPLREIAQKESLVAEHAAQFATDVLQLPMPEGFFQRLLQEGRCLVCLDALDEIPPSDRRRVAGRVEQMVRRYPESLFVVTSRRAGYDEEPLDERVFTRYTVQPMEDRDITAFVNSRFGEGAEEAESVLSMLNANPEVKALVANPMLMAIFNMVHRDIGDSLAALKRTGFYQKATEVLIKDLDDEGQRIGSNDIRKDILGAVAHHMHREGYETIGKTPLERFVVRFLQEEKSVENPRDSRRQGEEFLQLAERRTGLLVAQPGSDGPQFGFLHSTFREYLTAEYIHHRHFSAEPEAYWEEIREHLADAHWREVILFLLGILDRDYCTYVVRKILGFGDAAPKYEDHSSLGTHLQLAADALAQQSPMAPELELEIIDRLARHARDERSVMNVTAIRALGEIKHLHLHEAVVRILTEVGVDSPSGVIAAATALARLGEAEKAIAVLTGIVRESGDYRSRGYAVSQLVRLGEVEAAIDALTGIVNGSGDDGIRVFAASDLGGLGEVEAAIDALTGIVNGSGDDSIRYLAARQLGRLDEAESEIDVLTSIVNGSGDDGIRVDAARELGRLDDEEAAIDVLTDIAYGSGDDSIRVDAARELGDLGEVETAIDALTNIAGDPDVDPSVRDAAESSLSYLRKP